ncbi:hypothetical protein OGATHE_004062 [Ogataea polymorpha]|uniref:Uncharacterized protein n=1 Tax=Ogataea polymorpha TaxID=460523 RepID=A0A9P8P5C2_9ASCO|nr:hypothetical protein OGATHE_004062 [Ogataea polymorpha]
MSFFLPTWFCGMMICAESASEVLGIGWSRMHMALITFWPVLLTFSGKYVGSAITTGALATPSLVLTPANLPSSYNTSSIGVSSMNVPPSSMVILSKSTPPCVDTSSSLYLIINSRKFFILLFSKKPIRGDEIASDWFEGTFAIRPPLYTYEPDICLNSMYRVTSVWTRMLVSSPLDIRNFGIRSTHQSRSLPNWSLYGLLGLNLEYSWVRFSEALSPPYWIAFFGTAVSCNTLLITFAIAWNVCRDSFPPFKIAALPDLIAKAVMLAITSGRLSKMMSRTPTGHVSRVNVSPSSSSVARVTLLSGSSRLETSSTPSHIESNLPFLDKSSRLISDDDSLFVSATSMSFLLAARISSLAASSPCLI